MVEISTEQSMLITVVCFLSFFFIIVSMMPSDFVVASQNYRIVNVDPYFEAIDMSSFADTKNFTVGNDYFRTYFVLGGFNFRWTTYVGWQEYGLLTYDSWLIFYWNFEGFKWHDQKGIDQTDNEGVPWEALDANFNSSQQTCDFVLTNSRTTVRTYFAFNTTLYPTPTAALVNDDLHVLIGINFDKINTTFNAWNLIGMMLFFRAPEVNPIINAIIAIPVWVAIAYLCYILILKAIPFVGG